MVVGKTVTVTVLVVGIYFRAIGRSKNPGGGSIVVEIGLPDLPKSGRPCPPAPISLVQAALVLFVLAFTEAIAKGLR